MFWLLVLPPSPLVTLGQACPLSGLGVFLSSRRSVTAAASNPPPHHCPHPPSAHWLSLKSRVSLERPRLPQAPLAVGLGPGRLTLLGPLPSFY